MTIHLIYCLDSLTGLPFLQYR